MATWDILFILDLLVSLTRSPKAEQLKLEDLLDLTYDGDVPEVSQVLPVYTAQCCRRSPTSPPDWRK
jgi:hypothetical protein